VDEENKSAAALAESEQRFRQMFERNRSVKLIIDPADGHIEEANPAACEFYGYSRKRLLELRISDLNVLPPEEIQAEMALAQAEKRLYFNFRHRLASGELRDVEVYSGPIDTAHGQRLYSIVHDVTARRRAEAELKMFQIFSRHATDAHILLDEGARIRYVNNLACEFLGYSETELLQMSVPDIDPGYDKAAVQTHFEQCKLGRMPPSRPCTGARTAPCFRWRSRPRPCFSRANGWPSRPAATSPLARTRNPGCGWPPVSSPMPMRAW
jgi:PAS domain S-box-containing protein